MDRQTLHKAQHQLTRGIVTGLLTISFVVLPGCLAHAATTQECLSAVHGEWSPTETWIWRGLCTNSQADLNESSRFGPRPTMADRETWNARRTVSASFLESIISDSALTSLLGDQPIFLLGMRIPDPVDLSAANPKISIYLYNNRFEGAVTLVDAVFEKNLGFSGSFFARSLNGEGLEVRGNAFLDDVEIAGVELLGANIEGSLNANGMRVQKGFGLSTATILDDVTLKKSSFGDADLSFAKIGGNVVADEASITRGLRLDSAEVHSVFLDGADLRNLDISLATVSGFLDLIGARVLGDVDASSANISGSLILSDGASHPKWSAKSELDLRGASVGDIEDDPRAWAPKLLLGGFRYSLLSGDRSREEAVFADQSVEWYENWLHRDPTYSQAAYRQLDSSLRGLGRDQDADRIAMASNDEQSREAPIDRRALALLYKATVGYGYRPQRAIYAAALFIVLGAVVARKLPGGKPEAPSKLMLSIQRFTPFLSFGDAYNKVDTTSSAVPTWVRRYFYLHTVVGYVLAAFLLAALSQLTSVQ